MGLTCDLGCACCSGGGGGPCPAATQAPFFSPSPTPCLKTWAGSRAPGLQAWGLRPTIHVTVQQLWGLQVMHAWAACPPPAPAPLPPQLHSLQEVKWSWERSSRSPLHHAWSFESCMSNHASHGYVMAACLPWGLRGTSQPCPPPPHAHSTHTQHPHRQALPQLLPASLPCHVQPRRAPCHPWIGLETPLGHLWQGWV